MGNLLTLLQKQLGNESTPWKRKIFISPEIFTAFDGFKQNAKLIYILYYIKLYI